MIATVTEQQLRAIGALRDACSERSARICLMCGTAAADIDEWQKNGGRCGICTNETYRDECTRCRGECPASRPGHSRPCVSVAVYRKTGRIAFPDKIAEAKKRKGDKKPDPPKRPPEPVPPVPPIWASIGRTVTDVWNRYRGGLEKYGVFQGRSGRKEFWSFMVAQAAGLLVSGAFGGAPLFLLATLVPTLAVAVRRLHDVGLSGKWLWISVLWPISVFVLPTMLAWPGAKGPNRFGYPPP